MRYSIQDFSLANPIYRNATVTFYTVSGGVKTTTKAVLYAGTTGTATLANPQRLDSEGKFRQAVYVEVSVIAAITGLTIPDHDTGVFQEGMFQIGNGNPRGAWVSSRLYAAEDMVEYGNVGYICPDGQGHTSGVFATDLAAGRWQSLGVLQSVLASSTGAALVGEAAGGTVQDALDARLPEIGTYALLRAYSGPVASFQVRGVANSFDGGFGVFRVDVSDTTSTDNGGTILVDASGRRWKRDYSGAVNVCWFGADRTGAASSVAAANAAIAWLNSLTGSVKLFFPSGKYNLKAGVTQKITKDHFSIIGENAFITCESGRVFDFDNVIQMRRSVVEGFTFEYTFPTVSTTATPIKANKVLYLRIANIRLMNAPAAYYLSDCSNVVIDNITGTVVNIAANSLHYNSCSVVATDNVSLITNAGLQPVNPATPYTDAPVPGNVFIRITGTTNDTYRFGANVLCNRYYRGLYATVNPGEALLNVSFDHPVFDYCYDKGVYIENLGSSVANITFEDPYVQAMSGVGMHIKTTGGLTNLINIVRPRVYLSGSHGLFIESVGSIRATNVNIETPEIIGSNRLGTTGFDIYATYSRVNVKGGRAGINSLSTFGISLQGQYGVFFDNCDQYSVGDMEIGGSIATNSFSNNPASNYKARIVRNNRPAIGHAPGDSLTYTSTALDAIVSGGTYTNATPYREYVSVYGVAASGAATVEVNGAQYSTRSEWSGILEPGDTLKVTTAISCNRRKTRMP